MYKPHKILPLTSLRFFAAFYVVLYHTTNTVFPQLRDLATVHGRLLELGYVSVSFFFTLSGYILAVTYLPQRVSKGHFWKARFARIYPLFFLTLLLDTPNYLVGMMKQCGLQKGILVTTERVTQNALLLQAWIPRFRAMDYPNWSLSVEALFYFVFPFLLRAVSGLPLAGLALSGICTYAAGMAGVVAAMHTHPSLDVLKFNPLLHLSAFVCGTLLGISRFRAALSSEYAPVLLAAALTIFGAVVYFHPLIPLPLLHDGLLIPAFSCLILAFDSGFRSFDALLSHAALVLLGESSYALYLLHIPLWNLMFRLRLNHSPGAFCAYIVVSIALSIVCFRYVENPIRRAFKNGLSRRPKPALQTAATLPTWSTHGETMHSLLSGGPDSHESPLGVIGIVSSENQG